MYRSVNCFIARKKSARISAFIRSSSCLPPLLPCAWRTALWLRQASLSSVENQVFSDFSCSWVSYPKPLPVPPGRHHDKLDVLGLFGDDQDGTQRPKEASRYSVILKCLSFFLLRRETGFHCSFLIGRVCALGHVCRISGSGADLFFHLSTCLLENPERPRPQVFPVLLPARILQCWISLRLRNKWNLLTVGNRDVYGSQLGFSHRSLSPCHPTSLSRIP